MTPLWAGNRKELPDYCLGLARQKGGIMPPGVFGLIQPAARERLLNGGEWVYFDHSYFDRGWHRSNFRAIRNGLHLTHLLDKPTDRFTRWGVEIKPWRRSGTEVVVVPPSATQTAVYGCQGWLVDTLARLKAVTDRPVLVKPKEDKKPLSKWLETAWAVVTFASVAGVESALAGVPVFATENCPSFPVNAGPIESIETPVYAENREPWAAGLTYASWNWEEAKSVNWHDYRYELCA